MFLREEVRVVAGKGIRGCTSVKNPFNRFALNVTTTVMLLA